MPYPALMPQPMASFCNGPSCQTCVPCASPGQNLQAGLGYTQRDERAGQVGDLAQILSGKGGDRMGIERASKKYKLSKAGHGDLGACPWLLTISLVSNLNIPVV